ncbi:MAG: DivIVA domain-containing protein [Clostridia bacterium]|nr:DivIVA domain-containing protein [Clostridia bacterium]
MPISITAIEQKEFRTARKGYDPEEVDLYLDEICDHIDLLNRQIDMLQQRLAQATQGPGYARAAVPPPAAQMDYAAQAQTELNQARQKARGIIEEAQQDAAQIREEAEKMMEEAQQVRAQAEEMLQKANEQEPSVPASWQDAEDMQGEKDALQEEIDMLRAAARDYRQRFLRLVEDQKHVLNAEEELFD